MRKALDRVDVWVAALLAVGVSALAFRWGYPYPHPTLWPTLSELRYHLNLPFLACAGRVGLGLFAAVTYLALRVVWFVNREDTDEEEDTFFPVKVSCLVGALVFSLAPAVWRAAQYLSVPFLFLLIELTAVVIWLHSRGRLRLCAYSVAYLLLGFVGAANPIAACLLIYAAVSDTIGRWYDSLTHGQSEDDTDLAKTNARELVFSFGAGIFGFLVGIFLVSRYANLHDFSWTLSQIFTSWSSAWLAAFDHSVESPFMLTVAGLSVGVLIAMALGRRIRALGDEGSLMGATLLLMLTSLALVFILRATDGDARKRLALLNEFADQVRADSAKAKWLFTDGRLDDLLRIEFARFRQTTRLLDVLRLPTRAEGKILRAWAPEPGERDLFASGGSEVFRTWARERPDRLADAVWFLECGVLRQFGTAEQRTAGSVLTVKTDATRAACEAADAREEAFLARVVETVTHQTVWGRLFGGVDAALAEKFDALLWRVSRLAVLRADLLASVGAEKKSDDLRAAARILNENNGTLRLQGAMLERLLPTMNIVLTPREGLDIALKRADFLLAQRYAREIIARSPRDVSANFALGMVNLEYKEYFLASRYFRTVLLTKPNEPATLNNLALAYLKLGKLDDAKESAEQALRVNPNSAEIKKNLAEIQAAIDARPRIE